MKIGTKSVLFGAHCFLLHPIFVAVAWTKLYGFPLDLRIWIAFFVHDLGYWGKPNMDGPEGETHVELGAMLMHLFDGFKLEKKIILYASEEEIYNVLSEGWKMKSVAGPAVHFTRWVRSTYWRDFSMYHSRYYAKKHNAPPSKLCFADKLAFCYTPRWLYLPMVNATGEIQEYLRNAKKSESKHWKPVEGQRIWHAQLCEYMENWVNEHKDGRDDTWTDSNRNAKTDSGVTS